MLGPPPPSLTVPASGLCGLLPLDSYITDRVAFHGALMVFSGLYNPLLHVAGACCPPTLTHTDP